MRGVEGEKGRAVSPDDLLFRNAFVASPIGIALEDLEGRPLFVNPALCSMLGFSEEEMRRKHCAELSPPEDAAKDWALFEQLRAGSINQYQLEKRFLRRDGSLVWGRLRISLLESRASHIVIAMVEQLGERRTAEKADLERVALRLVEAQEGERARIARELHDDINQRLIMLLIDLEGLAPGLSASAPKSKQGIEAAIKAVRDLASDVHRLSHRLHSSKLEYLGLAAAAASLCRELSGRQQVKIDFHTEGIPKELPKEISLCLYRVLQEALQNALKHSGSGHFEVSLRGEPIELQLAVRDWGIGFDLAVARQGHGIGLPGMAERLKLVDGELSIETQPQSGTTVHARVPLAEKTSVVKLGG